MARKGKAFPVEGQHGRAGLRYVSRSIGCPKDPLVADGTLYLIGLLYVLWQYHRLLMSGSIFWAQSRG